MYAAVICVIAGSGNGYSAPSYYMGKQWPLMIWPWVTTCSGISIKIRTFFQENSVQNVIFRMSAILFRPHVPSTVITLYSTTSDNECTFLTRVSTTSCTSRLELPTSSRQDLCTVAAGFCKKAAQQDLYIWHQYCSGVHKRKHFHWKRNVGNLKFVTVIVC